MQRSHICNKDSFGCHNERMDTKTFGSYRIFLRSLPTTTTYFARFTSSNAFNLMCFIWQSNVFSPDLGQTVPFLRSLFLPLVACHSVRGVYHSSEKAYEIF